MALAGRTFDESKISRADDGKFGSGPGSAKKSGGGGGGEGGGGDGGGEEAKQPKDRKAAADARLGQAREQHAKATEDLAKADAGLKQAKAEAHAEVDKTEAARAHAAKEATKYADEARARRKALEKEADAIRATDPDRSSELDIEAEELEGVEAELRQEAKFNAKPDAHTQRLRAAIDAEDFDTIERSEGRQREVENDAAAEWAARHHIWKKKGFEGEPSPEEVARMADGYQNKQPKAGLIRVNPELAPRAPGEQVNRFVDEETTFGARAHARRKAAAKVARAERAVRVHEREVKRVAKRDKDADGDGRTGAAEEKDDPQV